jgi:hypothetical protein
MPKEPAASPALCFLHSWFLPPGNIYHVRWARTSALRQEMPGKVIPGWFLPGAKFCRLVSGLMVNAFA